MTAIPPQFQIAFEPQAHPDAVVRGPHIRFTVLTPRLLRLEFSPTDQFEDRPTQLVWYRSQPVPPFSAQTGSETITLDTDALALRYTVTERGFQPDTLAITLKDYGTTWRYGDVDTGNLRGTARTLDQADGYVPLEPGLLSRDGWTVVDDSARLAFDERCWLVPRGTDPAARDLYFFGYGHAYADCLADYTRIAGPVPMIPRWVLGNWWSRYWAYSQDELSGLMDDFEEYQVPLSVCIVDMDWHITQTGNTSTGWTGYTWNRNLFPTPDRFIQFLHDKGLHTALNLHPAEGVHPHEEMYPEMARRLGIDPASGQPVPFRIGSPEFARAYFEVLHHSYEQMGVDFWWIDWQQGHQSDLAGLDPLFWLNHLHFYDLARDGQRRTFIFSRWGGLGSHRHPVGFSGDSLITWDSLAFQPYFTATAANVCYGWWSHDIGGHFGGIEEPELYTRWVQYGVFSPILRLHTTQGQFYERRPWGWDDAEVLRVTRDAMQLRHALIPYLYSLAWQYHTSGVPFIRPMYYDHPARDEAYVCPQQYTFGDALIAAPFTAPRDPDTRLSRQVVWLPEGDWYHFFTGEHYTGDSWHALYGALDSMPVFARAGAIVPMGPRVGWGGVDTPTELDIHLFAGADGRFTLYEDDGGSNAYTSGAYALTEMTQTWHDGVLTFTIDPAAGAVDYAPAVRSVRVLVHGVRDPERITLRTGGDEQSGASDYDPETETLMVDAIEMPRETGLTLRIVSGESGGSLLSQRDRTREKLLVMLKAFRMHNGTKHRVAARLDEVRADPSVLVDHALDMAESQQRALLETITGAGIHRVRDTSEAELIVLWNNRADSQITARTSFAPGDGRFYYGGQIDSHAGITPRFACFAPPLALAQIGHLREQRSRDLWRAEITYYHTLTISYRDQTQHALKED